MRKCRGNCGLPKLQDEKFVVSSFGIISFYDTAKKTQSTKFGVRYIHFKDKFLKNTDDTKFYAPHENFQYNQICIDLSNKRKLSAADIEYLATKLGIHWNAKRAFCGMPLSWFHQRTWLYKWLWHYSLVCNRWKSLSNSCVSTVGMDDQDLINFTAGLELIWHFDIFSIFH